MCRWTLKPYPVFTRLAVMGIGLLVAGCLGTTPQSPSLPHEVDPVAAAYSLTLEPFDATRPVELDDRFLVSGEASPEGSLVSFEVQVPPEAITEIAGLRLASIIYAPLPPRNNASTVTDWGLLYFSPKPITLFGIPLFYSGPLGLTLQNVDPADPDHPLKSNPPRFVPASNSFLLPPKTNTVQLVLVARSNTTTPFGVVFSFTEFGSSPASETVEAYLDTPKPIRSLQPKANGNGFLFAFFVGDRDEATMTADAKVKLNQPVDLGIANPKYSFEFSSKFEGERGWGAADGVVNVGFQQVAEWSAEGTLHGKAFNEQGVYHPGMALMGTTSWPQFHASAEGAGPSSVTFNLDILEAGARPDLFYRHIELGTSLKALVGYTPTRIGPALDGASVGIEGESTKEIGRHLGVMDRVAS